uniref:Phosducin domain-containing protein n=1 Tax=Haptolina brevifila TaxID=156173 RepID=A0A7S2BSD8_9EUKA|mmetsp:Transcript_16203/g.32540  ORF Transcript_16203/g.32540 Transcript_16203/m.32540 type:complete len:248 (+) Transcript_16203:43-786(+)|eukprot:CAMPEP_0174720766 /NCGR_PEP_ID=MMETSP1094-20130205/34424_1 /TAXON_ID=156173 /ORGANISM="Chrysochromulina brevifilum, Strain UTEX LB 985" /LENGTH=247 /DNA_ID=CAMNT_0015921309 /DNA_START=43 /DNA_END=786 /DNA_ORIENTATION=-
MQSKNDASAFKAKGGAADILNAVNMEVTQEALMKNVNEELQDTAKAEAENQLAEWQASQKHAQVEKEDEFDDDDFEDDEVLQQLQQKRIDEYKKKRDLELKFHQQGHGEYREIAEEDFLKEVCGSQWCVVHFYHQEFFRCKIVDKHLRLIAPKHLSCKFLTLNAEKAPFFVTKLAIEMLPTVIVFKDGIVADQLSGFDELGGKDEFRTEVLEHWLSKAGCVIMKKVDVKKMEEDSDEDKSDDDDDDE